MHPNTTVSSNAWRNLRNASARSLPWTMILANVGSYSARITVPRPTHVSTRAHAGKRTSVNCPGSGIKSLTGFSAYKRASIAAPVTTTSWLKSGGSSAAMRNIHSTKSNPVTISVMGCSTCKRALTSKK